MKNILFTLMILFLLITACKKEDDSPPTITLDKHMFYQDFHGDTVAIMPSLDTLSFYLDVNGDSLSDMHFHLKDFNEWYGPHSYRANSISIYSIDSLQFIDTAGYCADPLDELTIINSKSPTHPLIHLLLDLPVTMVHCDNFYENGYVGFNLHQNGRDYLGWIHLQVQSFRYLVIHELAINTSPNLSVKIGHH